MPRPKTVTDPQVLDSAVGMAHQVGIDRLTFSEVAGSCGLSAATLVQRFGTIVNLRHQALLHAWDRLEARTIELGEQAEPTPTGAVDLLIDLSEQYDTGIETYADGLLLLREDLRDPELRQRGARWKATLTAILSRCLSDRADVPADAAEMLFVHWQGTVLWWAFEPERKLQPLLRDRLLPLAHGA